MIELSWNNLSIIPTKVLSTKKNKSTTAHKKILDNVYGKVQSGEALAILGGSGAGKTTLLNYLSKKIETGNLKIEGEVTLNNGKANSTILNSLSSYVMQDDILEATMTPVEILLFTAKLKLTNLSDEQIEERVKKMIKKLNLENAKYTKIGNNIIRGVSGGERKRTSIGVELISDPQIVFLDEPTTGLDSFNAFEVVNNICQLAKEDKKLIIFTIHQPSSEIFSLLDKVCILADGRTIYFGPQNKCLDCFDSILKLPCKLNYNPFEHFLEMTTLNCIFNPEVKKSYPKLKETEEDTDETKSQAYSDHMKNLSELFLEKRNNFYKQQSESNGLSEEMKEFIKHKQITRGFIYEFKRLFERNILVSQRNPQVLYFKIIQNIFTSILVSIIFQNVNINDIINNF
jgi:ABC-type multidrug transport system ATPase subunit